jgi:ring-1,2-phenylacetyl-CoA epoxidase subunit PaaE
MNDQLRRTPLVIRSVVKETSDTFSYHFDKPANFSYKAGQFLTLLFVINDKEVRRSYSLGSTPGVDDDIFITVKRKANGEVSRYLQDKFNTGDTIECLPPAGLFTIEEIASSQYIFLAAGSGIVPVFSLIKELLFHYPETVIQLFYQNNNEHATIFKNSLETFQQKYSSRFPLHFYFSNPSDHTAKSVRLNNILTEEVLSNHFSSSQTKFYTCGPEAFMRMVEFTLKVNGVKESNIKKENFIIREPIVPTDIDTAPKNVLVRLNNKEYRFPVTYPDTILSAALALNIDLPYSCRGGRCSACMTVCKSGRVKMSVNDVLTNRDLSNGYILTCTAHPETDVEITYP